MIGDKAIQLDPSKDDLHRFLCEACGKRFTRFENLRRHSLGHLQTSPERCSQCNKTFRRSDLLLRHVRSVHSGQRRKESSKSKDVRSKSKSTSPQSSNNGPSPRSLMEVIENLPPSDVIPSGPLYGTIPLGPDVSQSEDVVLAPFETEDLPHKYDSRLHHYFTRRPFFPPDFFDHFVEEYFDFVNPIFPVHSRAWFNLRKSPASLLRSIASLGCFHTGDASDEEMGNEFWHSGLSILQLYIEDDTTRKNSLWVCQSILIYSLSGFFSADSKKLQRITPLYFMLARNIRESKFLSIGVNEFIRAGEERTLLHELQARGRLVYGVYTLGIMNTLFCRGTPCICLAQISTPLPLPVSAWESGPENETLKHSGFLINGLDCLRLLESSTLVLPEVNFTCLILVCAIHENIKYALTTKSLLQGTNANESIDTLFRILDNLKNSVLQSLPHTKEDQFQPGKNLPTNPVGESDANLDLFWGLWHLAMCRLLCSSCSHCLGLISSGSEGIVNIGTVLSDDVKFWVNNTLNDATKDICCSIIGRLEPSFRWAIVRLQKSADHLTFDTPMTRLTVIHILLITVHIALFIDNHDKIDKNGAEDTNVRFRQSSGDVHIDECRYLFQKLVPNSSGKDDFAISMLNYVKIMSSSTGAWNIGKHIEKSCVFPDITR